MRFQSCCRIFPSLLTVLFLYITALSISRITIKQLLFPKCFESFWPAKQALFFLPISGERRQAQVERGAGVMRDSRGAKKSNACPHCLCGSCVHI